MNGSTSKRDALIAAGLATTLNPLILTVQAIVLWGTGCLTLSMRQRYGLPTSPLVFAAIGTLCLFIPEGMLGLVFGFVFPVTGLIGLSRGLQWAGAIYGAVFWLMPWAAVVLVLVQAWPGSWTGLWNELGFLLSLVLIKEVCTGLIIGYVLGSVEAKRRRAKLDFDAKMSEELNSATGSTSSAAKKSYHARRILLVSGLLVLVAALTLSILVGHDWWARTQARERLLARARAHGVAAADTDALAGGDRYFLSTHVAAQALVMDYEEFEQWVPAGTGKYFLLKCHSEDRQGPLAPAATSRGR
jgi:hypothetical protein